MNAAGAVECAGCRRAYSHGAWLTLPVVRRLTSRELRAFVVQWEEARVIEVRECTACGKQMARTTVAA